MTRTPRCYPLISTTAPEATTRNAAIAYLRLGFRPIPLWGLDPRSTPERPVCSCEAIAIARDAAAVGARARRRPHCGETLHVCPSPNCPAHSNDTPGTVHSGAGKHPRYSGWERGDLNESDVDRIWRSSYGVGLVMGPCAIGDLVAIDVDGATGRASLRGLRERLGRLPDTLTAQTGSGGVHFVYRVTSEPNLLTNRGRAQGSKLTIPGIDLRARGIGGGAGQIAVSPTMHWSGRRYRWTHPLMPVELPSEWYAELVRLTVR